MFNDRRPQVVARPRRGHIRVRRTMWRFACLGLAWLLGAWVAIRSLQGQEIDILRFDRSRTDLPRIGSPIADFMFAAVPVRPPVAPTRGLDDSPAACHFWHAPGPAAMAADRTATIDKRPYRYGDFGATSYPIRHQATGYYQSRTDWVWK
jgi:hypothetical protein